MIANLDRDSDRASRIACPGRIEVNDFVEITILNFITTNLKVKMNKLNVVSTNHVGPKCFWAVAWVVNGVSISVFHDFLH